MKETYFVSEENCRKIYEMIFGENVRKGRPSWLRNHDTVLVFIELDGGFCKSLRLAFEYNEIFNIRIHFTNQDENSNNRERETR